MPANIEDKLFLDRFNVDEKPHLRIIDGKVCLYICPANVYKLEQDRISVNYEGCLECGTCRVGCPHWNIEWRFPTGGFGIRHQFG